AKGVHFRSSLTTNLAYDLTDAHMRLMSGLSSILVSIDGTKETHDANRFFYKGSGASPYVLSMKNLAKLGRSMNIKVQAALPPSKMDKQVIADYYYTIHACGIPLDKISMGCIAP